MLCQRFNQKPSECWLDFERDSAFNVMSPTGPRHPFKGIHLPSKKTSINSESPRSSFCNSIAGNSSGRPKREQAWSINGALIGVHASHSMDGVAYAFTKGPAGQTPFPSLITMSSYFPQCHKSQPREVHGNPSSDLSSKSRPTHARKPSINVHPGYPTKGMDNPKSTIPRNKDSKTMSPANSQSSLNAFQLLQ